MLRTTNYMANFIGPIGIFLEFIFEGIFLIKDKEEMIEFYRVFCFKKSQI